MLTPTALSIARGTGTVTIGTSLMLGHDPTANLEAVTLQYLTNNFVTPAQGDARWVNVTGDAMSGGLSFGQRFGGSPADIAQHIALYRRLGWVQHYVWRFEYRRRHPGGDVVQPGYALIWGRAFRCCSITTRQRLTEAVTFQYSPTHFSTTAQGDLRWVNVTGDTMTGPLIVAARVTLGRGALTAAPPSSNTDLQIVGPAVGGSTNITIESMRAARR